MNQRNANIKNFVFFDIETTGLPYEEYNKTRITEMCFVIVQSEHIALGVYPRIQNKLSLCFNPQKLISPTATKITGLSNELLQQQPVFNKNTCETIKKFLDLQNGPLCLVAHNGNYFDYPILRAELQKTGCSTPFDDILCIDSLKMFRDLDQIKLTSKIENESLQPISVLPALDDIHQLPTQRTVPVELCDNFDQILCDAVDSIENEYKLQMLNEHTPTKSGNDITICIDKTKDVMQDHLYFKPSSTTGSGNTSDNTTIIDSKLSSSRGAKRRLNFGNPSYKLVDIYKRLTDKENENAHFADQDVSMLIECAATLGQDFVDWANANAVELSTIPAMRPGSKIGL